MKLALYVLFAVATLVELSLFSFEPESAPPPPWKKMAEILAPEYAKGPKLQHVETVSAWENKSRKEPFPIIVGYSRSFPVGLISEEERTSLFYLVKARTQKGWQASWDTVRLGATSSAQTPLSQYDRTAVLDSTGTLQIRGFLRQNPIEEDVMVTAELLRKLPHSIPDTVRSLIWEEPPMRPYRDGSNFIRSDTVTIVLRPLAPR